VATVLAELAEQLDPRKLAAAAATGPMPWAQRLGYLLELAGESGRTDELAAWVRHGARRYVPLATPGARTKVRSRRWRLLVNAKVEVEA
jgi:hypothetical protein